LLLTVHRPGPAEIGRPTGVGLHFNRGRPGRARSPQPCEPTVGTTSKLVGYGNNRADYTFIPGGMIPGVVIIQPDFPELKDNWPFLCYENEYVVDAATSFILAANAAEASSH
jgi:hypothetical protein